MSTRESCQGQVLRCTFEEVIQTKSRASCIRPFSVQAKLKSQTCHQPGERRQEENRSTHQAICFGMPALCGRCRLCRSDEVARLLKGQARYFCLLMSSRASPRFSCGLHMIPQCLRGAPRIFGVKSGAQFVFPKLQTKAVEHLLYKNRRCLCRGAARSPARTRAAAIRSDHFGVLPACFLGQRLQEGFQFVLL